MFLIVLCLGCNHPEDKIIIAENIENDALGYITKLVMLRDSSYVLSFIPVNATIAEPHIYADKYSIKKDTIYFLRDKQIKKAILKNGYIEFLDDQFKIKLKGNLTSINSGSELIVGGGVVTDITGYAATVYMRGLRFGFVPTTVLAMADAAIGGKNGVDVGVYKNLVGTINQPEFLLYDISLLKSLPANEWVNGFAEIIKHGCIKDAAMFKQLLQHKISDYKKDSKLLAALIRRNAMLKAEVVKADEFEQGERRLLNFGHTLGHAIENLYSLSHGEAIAVGMVAACVFSESLTGFKGTAKVIDAFEQYGLPTNAAFDKTEVFKVLQMDKKKERSVMNYVLLEKIGKAVVQQIAVTDLEKMLAAL